eukprot:Mycagemm_TRINITY_DN9616_c0_g1::TRINITY_DN9616_c0_g1_i2::g.2546::m.2546 type:complete len:152 gc:universal TRINITY_DN9616_c0_g1_i2:317-772(+)
MRREPTSPQTRPLRIRLARPRSNYLHLVPLVWRRPRSFWLLRNFGCHQRAPIALRSMSPARSCGQRTPSWCGATTPRMSRLSARFRPTFSNSTPATHSPSLATWSRPSYTQWWSNLYHVAQCFSQRPPTSHSVSCKLCLVVLMLICCLIIS